MKNLKSIIALMFVAVMIISLSACSTETPPAVNPEEEISSESSADEPEKEAGGQVVVYSPHDADPMNDGYNMFMDKYPEITVEPVSAGTGELLNRIAAESENPLADVLWGGGADSLAAFKEYFQPYVSVNDDMIDAAYKDADGLWIGESPLPMVIIYNKELLEKDSIKIPEAWNDLLDPALKGKIAFTMPSKSGSAYTQLVTMILGHGGKEDGWKFIEELYANLDGKLVSSSSDAHKMVSDGEYYVGLTLEKAAVQYASNENIGFSYPSDGTSAVPDGVAMVKGAPNEENAKIFIDYVTSKEAQEAQSEKWGRRPVRPDVPVGGNMAKLEDIVLVDYDFDWAATDKEAIIEKFNGIMVGD